MLECPRCQAPLPDSEARFCTNCGARLTEPASSEPLPLTEPAPPLTEPAPPLTEPAPPPEELPAPQAEPSGTPWERRAEIGLGAALLDTTVQVIRRPRAFFRAMPVTGGLKGPLLYAVIVGYVGLVAAGVYDYVFRAVMGPALERFGGTSEMEKFLPTIPGWLGLLLQVVLGPALVALFLFVFAGVTHLMLMLLGGAQRDFEATFRVAAFARATHLLQIVVGIVPVCGAVLTLVYEIVVTTIGLAEVHGISRGKAAAAILLPLLIFCCCLSVLLIVATWGTLSALSGAR